MTPLLAHSFGSPPVNSAQASLTSFARLGSLRSPRSDWGFAPHTPRLAHSFGSPPVKCAQASLTSFARLVSLRSLALIEASPLMTPRHGRSRDSSQRKGTQTSRATLACAACASRGRGATEASPLILPYTPASPKLTVGG